LGNGEKNKKALLSYLSRTGEVLEVAQLEAAVSAGGSSEHTVETEQCLLLIKYS
jgi:hypothetical protein